MVYKSGEGTGGNKTFAAEYNKKYTILAYDNSQINFTPPANKPYFSGWLCENNNTVYQASIPASVMRTSNTITLVAQWGSPWKKVKAIWIYNLDTTPKWRQYKIWVNKKE